MPAPVRRRLHDQLAPYRERHPRARWTHPDAWHLTLLFLGPVEASLVPLLAARCDELARGAAGPYTVSAHRGGGRDRRGDGVGWIELSEGAAQLLGLARAAAESIGSDLAADTPPQPTRSAHLTVVRHADAAAIDDLRAAALGPLAVRWNVDRVELVRSRLGRDRARYETLHASPL